MKKEYMKPATLVEEAELINIICTSIVITGTSTTGLDPEDAITIDEEALEEGSWGR